MDFESGLIGAIKKEGLETANLEPTARRKKGFTSGIERIRVRINNRTIPSTYVEIEYVT